MSSPKNAVSRSKPVRMFFVILVALNLAIGIVAMFRADFARSHDPLLIHCAESLRSVMIDIAKNYERETGIRTELSFGDSQALLANITEKGGGDLFLPANDSYISVARERNLIDTSYPLAVHTPDLKGVKATLAVSVLKRSSRRQAAEKFARYIATPENGRRYFHSETSRNAPP